MPASMGRRLTLEEAAALVRPRDTVTCGLAPGQPVGLLEALGARPDLEDVVLYTGLLVRPYALLQNRAVRVVSGFFGPIALSPDSNQGPLLGIFLTGPGGAVAGTLLGIVVGQMVLSPVISKVIEADGIG